jgi:hypothetical protein
MVGSGFGGLAGEGCGSGSSSYSYSFSYSYSIRASATFGDEAAPEQPEMNQFQSKNENKN